MIRWILISTVVFVLAYEVWASVVFRIFSCTQRNLVGGYWFKHFELARCIHRPVRRCYFHTRLTVSANFSLGFKVVSLSGLICICWKFITIFNIFRLKNRLIDLSFPCRLRDALSTLAGYDFNHQYFIRVPDLRTVLLNNLNAVIFILLNLFCAVAWTVFIILVLVRDGTTFVDEASILRRGTSLFYGRDSG